MEILLDEIPDNFEEVVEVINRNNMLSNVTWDEDNVICVYLNPEEYANEELMGKCMAYMLARSCVCLHIDAVKHQGQLEAYAFFGNLQAIDTSDIIS